MSSQDDTGIPISASHKQQSFKLIELPPELLQLLESDNPPTLYLKSSAPESVTGPDYAVLCALDATYRIQQKNSSNPIMILEPYVLTETESDNVASTMPCNAVRTIATIEDTLELYRQESDTANPVPAKVNKWHEKFAKGRGATKEKN